MNSVFILMIIIDIKYINACQAFEEAPPPAPALRGVLNIFTWTKFNKMNVFMRIVSCGWFVCFFRHREHMR